LLSKGEGEDLNFSRVAEIDINYWINKTLDLKYYSLLSKKIALAFKILCGIHTHENLKLNLNLENLALEAVAFLTLPF